MFGEERIHPLILSGDDGGMHDKRELAGAAVVEGERGEGAAVQGAVRAEYLLAEVGDDGVEDGLAGLHERAADRVGFNDVRATCMQLGGDG